MQMLLTEKGIQCPACELELQEIRNQGHGRRVLIMRHPANDSCSHSNRTLRVDTRTGYSEVYPNAQSA